MKVLFGRLNIITKRYLAYILVELRDKLSVLDHFGTAPPRLVTQFVDR